MSDNQQILPLSDAEKLSYAIQHFKSAKALMDSAQEDSKIFLENTLCTGTVVHLLQMGGEAAGDVSQKIKSKHPDVPWVEIREMRNGFAHTYMGQETGLAWNYRSVLAGWIESLSSLRKRLDAMEMLSENARYAVALNALFDILPMAEAGGFLDTDGICLRNHRSYDASPKKVDAPTFKMFIAAFLSRSCTVPQCGHVHSRTCKSFVAGFRAPQI